MSNGHSTTQFEFETFRKTPRPGKNGFNVSLYRSHYELRMNQRTYEALGSPGSILLMYDSRRRVIGIKPAYDGDPDAIPLHRGNGRTAEFSMYEFLEAKGLHQPISIRFLDPHIEDGILILDLNRITPIRSSRRKGIAW